MILWHYIKHYILLCSSTGYCQRWHEVTPQATSSAGPNWPGNPVQPGEACTGHIAGGSGSHGGCAEEVPWLGSWSSRISGSSCAAPWLGQPKYGQDMTSRPRPYPQALLPRSLRDEKNRMIHAHRKQADALPEVPLRRCEAFVSDFVLACQVLAALVPSIYANISSHTIIT